MTCQLHGKCGRKGKGRGKERINFDHEIQQGSFQFQADGKGQRMAGQEESVDFLVAMQELKSLGLGDGRIPLKRKPKRKTAQEDSTWAAYFYSSTVWALYGPEEDQKSSGKEESTSNSSGSKSNLSKDSASQKSDERIMQPHGKLGFGTCQGDVNGVRNGAVTLHNNPKESKNNLKRSASCRAVRKRSTDENEDWGPYLYNSFVDALYGIEDGSAKYHAIEFSGTRTHSEPENEVSLEDALAVEFAGTSVRSKRPLREVSVQRYGHQRKGSSKGSGKGIGKGKGKNKLASGMSRSLSAAVKGRIIF